MSSDTKSPKKNLDLDMREKLDRVNKVVDSSKKTASSSTSSAAISKSKKTGVMAASMGFSKSTTTTSAKSASSGIKTTPSGKKTDMARRPTLSSNDVDATLNEKMARAKIVMGKSSLKAPSASDKLAKSANSSASGGGKIRAALVGELSGSAHDLSSGGRRVSDPARRSSKAAGDEGNEEAIDEKLKRVDEISSGGILAAVFPPTNGQPLVNPIHKQHGSLRDHVLGADGGKRTATTVDDDEKPEDVAEKHWQKANNVKRK